MKTDRSVQQVVMPCHRIHFGLHDGQCRIAQLFSKVIEECIFDSIMENFHLQCSFEPYRIQKYPSWIPLWKISHYSADS